MNQQAADTRLLAERQHARWVAAGRDGSLGAVMQALYEREINCGLSSFWDGGWTVWIGDDMNGRRAEQVFDRDDFDQIATWLYDSVERMYSTPGEA